MSFEAEFSSEAQEYDPRHFPPVEFRHYPENFYIATDTAYLLVERDHLVGAVGYFQRATRTEGQNASLYLFQGSVCLATYNGLQTEPEGETFWHVQQSNLEEWLDALSALD